MRTLLRTGGRRGPGFLPGLCVLALALAGAGGVAAAPPGTSGFAPRDGLPTPGFGLRPLAEVSLDQAVQMAERRYAAKVVKVAVSEVDGRRVYVLRLLSDQGRVWTVRVDAGSGSFL
jgi:hypothetical protein